MVINLRGQAKDSRKPAGAKDSPLVLLFKQRVKRTDRPISEDAKGDSFSPGFLRGMLRT